jgi:hypothetical protein
MISHRPFGLQVETRIYSTCTLWLAPNCAVLHGMYLRIPFLSPWIRSALPIHSHALAKPAELRLLMHGIINLHPGQHTRRHPKHHRKHKNQQAQPKRPKLHRTSLVPPRGPPVPRRIQVLVCDVDEARAVVHEFPEVRAPLGLEVDGVVEGDVGFCEEGFGFGFEGGEEVV